MPGYQVRYDFMENFHNEWTLIATSHSLVLYAALPLPSMHCAIYKGSQLLELLLT